MRDTIHSVTDAESSSYSCAAPSDRPKLSPGNPSGISGTGDPGNYEVPWRIALPSDGDDLERGVITRNQTLVAHPTASELEIGIEDAFMRRIVACVNACAGFRIDELEAMQLGDLAVLFYENRAQQAEAIRKVQG